jgi:hypothetical protein
MHQPQANPPTNATTPDQAMASTSATRSFWVSAMKLHYGNGLHPLQWLAVSYGGVGHRKRGTTFAKWPLEYRLSAIVRPCCSSLARKSQDDY